MELISDFLTDANSLCASFLNKNKITQKHISDSILDYFVFRIRIPVQKIRVIHKASGFSCPIGYENKLTFLENAIENGSDLMPFMTKKTRDLNNEDYMLNDWGIFHLHINDSFENGFIKRSAYLLLAFIDSDNAYFIKCIDHPRAGELLPWGLKEYLEIIDENWPFLTDSWIINRDRDVQLTTHFTEEEYVSLRKHGINACVELTNGKIVLGIGGGMAGDLSPAKAVLISNEFKRELQSLSGILEQFIEKGILLIDSNMSGVRFNLIDFVPFNCYTLQINGDEKLLELYKTDATTYMIREMKNKNVEE